MIENDKKIFANKITHSRIVLENQEHLRIALLRDSENSTSYNQYTLGKVSEKLTGKDVNIILNVIDLMNYQMFKPKYKDSIEIKINEEGVK